MAGFQTSVPMTQAPGIEGDFATANPRHATIAPVEGAFQSGASGLTMGRFAWIHTDGKTLNNTGTGAPQVFVRRTFVPGLATYDAESGMAYLPGMPVGDVFADGDFWVKNVGAGAVTRGMKAFVALATGAVQFAAAGATVADNIETRWYAHSAGAAGELIKISPTPLQ